MLHLCQVQVSDIGKLQNHAGFLKSVLTAGKRGFDTEIPDAAVRAGIGHHAPVISASLIRAVQHVLMKVIVGAVIVCCHVPCVGDALLQRVIPQQPSGAGVNILYGSLAVQQDDAVGDIPRYAADGRHLGAGGFLTHGVTPFRFCHHYRS